MTKKLKEGDKIRVEGELKRLQWREDKQEFELADEPKEVKPLHTGGFSITQRVKTTHGERIYADARFDCTEKANKFVRSIDLRNKARQAMSEDWGDERPDWSDDMQIKYCVKLYRGKLHAESRDVSHDALHFRTREAAEKFRDSITVEDYLLIVGL